MLGSGFLIKIQQSEGHGGNFRYAWEGRPPGVLKEVREGPCFDLGSKCSGQEHSKSKGPGAGVCPPRWRKSKRLGQNE